MTGDAGTKGVMQDLDEINEVFESQLRLAAKETSTEQTMSTSTALSETWGRCVVLSRLVSFDIVFKTRMHSYLEPHAPTYHGVVLLTYTARIYDISA